MSSAEVDAELARSILSCPESAELAVDGYPSVGCDDDLGLRDEDGVPTFSCRSSSELAEAGRRRQPGAGHAGQRPRPAAAARTGRSP